MITLLMCLFMVLWSISSVNISKLQELQRSLQQAFIGKVLDGGKSVLDGQPTSVQGSAGEHARPDQPDHAHADRAVDQASLSPRPARLRRTAPRARSRRA